MRLHVEYGSPALGWSNVKHSVCVRGASRGHALCGMVLLRYGMCIDSTEYKSIFNGHGLRFSLQLRRMETMSESNAGRADTNLRLGIERYLQER